MRIKGVYTPIITPFHADESVDETAYIAVIEQQIQAGVSGLVIGGTTGEYYAMSIDERMHQLRFAAKTVGGRVQMVAGCNTGATRDVIALAQHAKALGYEAIMLSAPPTSLPSQDQLAAHIVACVDEGGLPVILYNYPARAGVEFGFDCLDALADHPGVIAIKESSGDFSRFLALNNRYAGRIQVMCGSDDQAFDYMAWGVNSWLSGPANVLPCQCVVFTETMNRGDFALGRQQFAALWPFMNYLESGQFNAKVKAGMSHLGIAAGTVRRPMTSLAATEMGSYAALLDGVIATFDNASAVTST
jgi:4-hydroxy-tetrahydrodipicolinate synthase